jgi:ABC-type bacteriocin/lantibiotic exporter with double-glycine peptidase domain
VAAGPALAQDLKIPTGPPPRGPIIYDVPEGVMTPPRLQLERSFQSGVRCGPNALFLLLRLCRVNVDYETVLKATPIGKNGASLEDLRKTAVEFGLTAQIRGDVSPDDLTRSRLPAIVHLKASGGPTNPERQDHFIVVADRTKVGDFQGVDTTNMTFAIYTVEALARNMSGYALFPQNSRVANVYRVALGVLLIVLIANIFLGCRRYGFSMLRH